MVREFKTQQISLTSNNYVITHYIQDGAWKVTPPTDESRSAWHRCLWRTFSAQPSNWQLTFYNNKITDSLFFTNFMHALYIYYIPLHVSSTTVLIFRRTIVWTQHLVSSLWVTVQCTGYVTTRNLCTEQPPKECDDTRYCTNTTVLLKMIIIVLETCRGM